MYAYRSLLVQLAERHGEDVAKLVSETIRRWDSKTIVDKLEGEMSGATCSTFGSMAR